MGVTPPLPSWDPLHAFRRRARTKVQKRPLQNTDGDLRKKSMAELFTLCLEAGCVLCTQFAGLLVA